MAAAACILPMSDEKFKKNLSWPMRSCATLSMDKVESCVVGPRSPDVCVSIRNGVPFFYGMKEDPETKDRIASLNEFVRSRSTLDDAPEAVIVAALKQCGFGKYTAPIGFVSSNSFYEDDVGIATASRPPMVINDDHGKAKSRTMNDVVAGSPSEHEDGLYSKASPRAPPLYEGYPVFTAGTRKGDEISPSECAYGEYGGNYSAAPPNFGKVEPAADAEYPPNFWHDNFGKVEPAAYAECHPNFWYGGGGSSGSTASSFKNAIVKDRDEASSSGSGNTAPKRMKKEDNNFDTGVDCMAGFSGCVPLRFKVWVKRSKDKVYD